MSLNDSVYRLQDVFYLQHITSFHDPRFNVTLFTPAPPFLRRCARKLLMVNSIIQKSLIPNLTQRWQEVWDARILIDLLKPTGHVMHQQFNITTTVRSAHTVFMCFVFIWEQTATCATYSINWLVFRTERKNVYSAVRTGPLTRAVCASYVNG